jgi:uncharacterized protein (TIGR03663 family)
MAEPVIIPKASTNSPSTGLVGGIRTRLARAVTRGHHWWWTGVSTAVLATGTLLRLYQLDLKPLHHDEGVNGFFLLGLFREGIYRYNAANYHGPTLYYFALITSSVNNLLTGADGPSTIAIRVVPVLFGIGVLVLLIDLRHRLGDAGTLTATVLAALSPGMVYISRDFIHEMLLVFFTLWLVVCGLQFWDTKRPRHLMLASIAAALMFCTKETALISIVALGLSAGFALIWVPGHKKLNSTEWGGWRRIILLAVASGALFLTSAFLFFSSFLGNYPQGIHDAATTYSYWARTGMIEHTAPWYTYTWWLIREEGPIFILGMAGTALAVFRRRNRFAVFAGMWAVGLLVAYSILPYKTPWILPNMVLPMSLAVGYAGQELWDTRTALLRSTIARVAPGVLLFFALAVCFYQSVQLNFFHYDDDRYAYPYAQTRRAFLDLVDQVNGTAGNAGRGFEASIAVMSPDYWPLPWYLRNYKSVGYYGQVVPTGSTIVIGSRKQMAELTLSLAGRYRFVGAYALRPGVDLVLFVANR